MTSMNENLPSSLTARYQHLVNSNEPPNAVEEGFFRDAVLKTEARLAHLDEEIRALQAQHAQLQDQQRKNHSVLFPLRRLPPETLAEIFSWTLPPMHELKGDVSDMKASPWVLAQVSSRWRDISVSTPSLWCNIFVAYGGDRNLGGFPDPQPEMVWTQVERAAGQNLQIRFYAFEDHEAAQQVELFEFLAKHSARWEQLDIQVAAPLVPHLSQLRGHLPALRRIWVQWDTEDSQIGVDSIDCFELAPSLLDIGISRESRFIPILFPAEHLTAYRVEGPWDMHHRILKIARNIIEARICTCSDENDLWPEPSSEYIDMLHLRRLFVSDLDVFAYIRAPALDELAINVGLNSPLEHLDPFLTRSSCAPWRLCLRGSQVSAVGCTAVILKKLPSVTSFMLIHDLLSDSDDSDSEDEVLLVSPRIVDRHCRWLTVERSTVAPHLSEISFGIRASVPKVNYPLFLKMLESRHRAPDCALRTAALLTDLDRLPDPATLNRIEALRKDGLRLQVESGAEAAFTVDRWTFACPWNRWS